MKRKAAVAAAVILALAGFAGSFFLGRASVPKTISWQEVTTFPAVITSKSEGTNVVTGKPSRVLTVKGLPDNGVNDRGDYFVPVTEETMLSWHGVPITWEDLDVGDRVKITYTGEVQYSDPAGITQVLAVQLTEDEL